MTRGIDDPAGGRTYGHSLADVYELAYHFKDYAKESEFVTEAIRRRHPGANSLLEIAVGTGRFLQFLQRSFPEVEGLDLSEAMLARARERLPDVPLHAGDMTSFQLSRRFDVVCCLFHSIAYCRTVERLHATVQAMAAHLAPGGLLLIDPYYSPDTYRVDRVTLNHAEQGEFKLAWMYVSEREGELARLRIHYIAGTPSGVEHFEELHELGLFTRADYERAFSDASLELEFDDSGPTPTGLYIGRRAA